MAKKAGKIYVVGHKNPDTDSICSAIAYANLKREITGNDYIAKRAGQINEETHYVLQKFGVKVPNLLENVKLQVKDMDIHQIDGVGPNVSLKDTWTSCLTRRQCSAASQTTPSAHRSTRCAPPRPSSSRKAAITRNTST